MVCAHKYFIILLFLVVSAYCLESNDNNNNNKNSSICKVTRIYCGWQLNKLLGRTLYQTNDLYQYVNGQRATVYDSCNGNCIGDDSFGPVCQKFCTIDDLYCGHELRSMNWYPNRFRTNVLYRCINRTHATMEQECGNKCILSGSTSMCNDCEPGVLYCGYKLKWNLRWNITHNPYNTLYYCNGTEVIVHKICTRGCVDSTNVGSGMAYCAGDITEPPGRTSTVSPVDQWDGGYSWFDGAQSVANWIIAAILLGALCCLCFVCCQESSEIRRSENTQEHQRGPDAVYSRQPISSLPPNYTLARQPVELSISENPPSYEEVVVVDSPPAYEEATKLPTYAPVFPSCDRSVASTMV